MGKIDYYEVLQVSPNASSEVIDAAYRRLTKMYHPDAGGSEEMMKLLNEAYSVLKDPVLRKQYDASRVYQTSGDQREHSRSEDFGMSSSRDVAQSGADAASHDTRARALRRRRLSIILATVILAVVAFTLAWCLKSGKLEELQVRRTSSGGSKTPKAAMIESVASPVEQVNTLEYFPLDTVHSLTVTTAGSGSLQATRLQHYLGKQAVEDREVYVVGEAYISDGKIGDFEYTLYFLDERQDIYWAGQAEGKGKVKWERKPRMILPGKMEIGREYVLRAVEVENVLSDTTTAKAVGFARVTVSGEEFEECLVVEKKMFVRAGQPDGSYNILEDYSTVYYARGVGPVYSRFTTKSLTEKDGKQTTTSVTTAEQYFANTATLKNSSPSLPAPSFDRAVLIELYPDLIYCQSTPLFEGSLVVVVGLEPTKWYDSELISGNLHVIVVGWNGSKWVTLWRLVPLETQVLSAQPQELLEILSTEEEKTALVVARLGSLGNHPESHIVAFTVSKEGAASLEFMRFGYVTSFGRKAGVIEARWEEYQRGYQVYRFALQQGRCSIRRVPLMEYRPEGVASIIEARFVIVNDGGIRKAVASRQRMLKAEVGQTVVFVPSDVKAEAELTERGLRIYTDAWNGPPLTVCEANRLRETFYTFEEPGIVHFKLLTRNEERELVENLQIGEAPQPTFTVIVE